MKNRTTGALAAAGALAVCALSLGRNSLTAQAQTSAPERTPSALNLSAMTGKICYLKYQDGASSPSTATGTLKQADDNWVVLDVLELQGNNIITGNGNDLHVITGADGRKRLQAVYARANEQKWIASRFIIAADFDADAIVR